MQWYNEPPAWSAQGDAVTLSVAPKTDFWRKTHDGGVRDNGHFYYRSVSGDFSAQVKFSGKYTALYDQAGLMVRVDAETWLKCGVEYVGGVQYASAVVTRDYSDWSVLPLDGAPDAVRHQVDADDQQGDGGGGILERPGFAAVEAAGEPMFLRLFAIDVVPGIRRTLVVFRWGALRYGRHPRRFGIPFWDP